MEAAWEPAEAAWRRAFACDIPAGVASTSSQEVVELLGRVPVFSTLERGDLERIAQLAVPRSFAPGEVVFREGDASDTCYIVREGHARAIRRGRNVLLIEIYLSLGTILKLRWARPSYIGRWWIFFASAA